MIFFFITFLRFQNKHGIILRISCDCNKKIVGNGEFFYTFHLPYIDIYFNPPISKIVHIYIYIYIYK